MRRKAVLQQFFVFLTVLTVVFSICTVSCQGGSLFSEELPYFPQNYNVADDFFFSQPQHVAAQSEPLILGQNRYKKYLKNYGLWGSMYGYEGRLRPKNSTLGRFEQSDLGMQFGIDFPGKKESMFSKCFYYSYSSPENKIRNSQIAQLDGSKLEATNHLFGLRWNHYGEGLFMLFGLNGGFDDYKFQIPSIQGTHDASGWQMGAHGEIGLDVEFEKLTLRPHLGFDYRWLNHNDLGSSANTIFEGQTYNALYSNFGMRAYYNISPLLDWQTRLSWLHNCLKMEPIQMQRFGSVAGMSPSTQLFFDGHPGRDWLWFGTGLKLHFGDTLAFFVDYDLTFNKHATTHTGSLMAILSW